MTIEIESVEHDPDADIDTIKAAFDRLMDAFGVRGLCPPIQDFRRCKYWVSTDRGTGVWTEIEVSVPGEEGTYGYEVYGTSVWRRNGLALVYTDDETYLVLTEANCPGQMTHQHPEERGKV